MAQNIQQKLHSRYQKTYYLRHKKEIQIRGKSKPFKYWKNKLDEAMSKLVREKGVCEKCGNRYDVFNDAHVVGRRNFTLRWCILNHLCLCARCHMWWWHEEPLEAALWFQKTYPERYTYLMVAKNKLVKRTEEDYKVLLEAIHNKDFDKLLIDIS